MNEVDNRIEKAHFSLNEASAYSGLSGRSLRELIEAGKLKASRPLGKKIMISRASLDELFASTQVKVPQAS